MEKKIKGCTVENCHENQILIGIISQITSNNFKKNVFMYTAPIEWYMTQARFDGRAMQNKKRNTQDVFESSEP